MPKVALFRVIVLPEKSVRGGNHPPEEDEG